jgi:hypothetical protein
MTTGSVARLLGLAAVLALCGRAASFSKCDVNHDHATTVADVQIVINEALGAAPPNDDLNGDGVVNIVDVQIEINAALGLGCAADPALKSIVPNTGLHGSSGINVTISGSLTGFTNGSVIDLGAGITVTNVVAPNAATLTATLSIAPTAATTTRDLTVDGLTLPRAFTVTMPSSVAYTYDSQGRLATVTYTSSTGSVTITTYSYDAAGNRTAVVAQ